MLSSIATLSYDCRRSEFFTDQLYAALKLIDRGVFSGSTAGSMHGEVGQTQFMPKTVLEYGVGSLETPSGALMSTANYLHAHGWTAGDRLSARRTDLRRHPGLERGDRLSGSHRHHRQADRRRTITGPRNRKRRKSPLRHSAPPRRIFAGPQLA